MNRRLMITLVMNIVAQMNAIISLRLLDAVHVSYDVTDQRSQKIFLSKILSQFLTPNH